MKNLKKLLSLLTVLSMVAIMFSVIPVQVSAAAGDVFTIDNLPDGWRFYTSSYVTRTSGSKFTLGSSTNKGNGLDNYGILAANSLSTEVVTASKTYRIKFRIETWFTLAQLEVNIDTGTALWSRTNSVQRFTDLSSRSSNSSGGGGSKLYTDLTFDVTTPSTITGNQHFVIGIIPTSGNVGSTANLAFKDITITELGTYNVYDGNGDPLTPSTIIGLPGDSVYDLIAGTALAPDGYYVTASPDTIANDTTDITLTYVANVTTKATIDFGSSYGGNSHAWAYIQRNGAAEETLEITGEESIHAKVTSNKSRDFNYRAVLLANDRADAEEDLVAGNTYRLTFKLKTFPRYTPISSLAAEIKFGDYLWTNFATGEDSDIDITGEELENAVTGYSAAPSGSVTFTVSLYVKLPEAAQWTGSRRHIMLSVYGGEYWLDDVTIQTTLAFPVEDENGSAVGTAYGHIGDKVSKLIPDSMKSNADYTYSVSPSYIANFDDVITLTKTLKSNILEKVSFGSEAYGGYANTGSKYYETASGATVTRNDSVMHYNNSNSGNTFGNRSVVIANNRTSALLTPGEKYALKIRIGTWDNNFANLTAQIGFGDQCWVSGELVTFSNAQIRDSIIGYGNSHVSMSGTDKKDLFLLLKFTVPTGIDGNKNLVLSLYGANKVSVTTYLYSAMIYSASQITFTSYDGTINAVAKGIEGDTATVAFDSTRNIKITNFSETFDYSTTKTVSAGNYSYIERGDVDGNSTVATSLDFGKLNKYILGESVTIDTFGANVNATTLFDESINIIDYVFLKNIAVANAGVSPAEPISGLSKSGYRLAWSYEFNDNTVNGDYFDMQYGMNRKYADITGVGSGEPRYNYVKDGALVLSPSDNYGAGNALVCDAYTTKTTMKFTYGYLEVCAKLPFSRADFPAIWLKSYGDPLYEIDLVETLGSSTTTTCNLHYWKDDHDYSADLVSGRDKNITDTGIYHKYGFEWYKEGGVSYIAFYVDGVHVKTLSKNDIGYNADFNEEMYLILENLPITNAVYDNIHSWAGAAEEATHADYPMDMCIDYVRLYQSSNNSGNTLNTFN